MAVPASLRRRVQIFLKIEGIFSYHVCKKSVRSRHIHCSSWVHKGNQKDSAFLADNNSWDVTKNKLGSHSAINRTDQEKRSYIDSSSWKFDDRLNVIARRGQQFGIVDNSKCIGQPTFETHPHLLMDNQVITTVLFGGLHTLVLEYLLKSRQQFHTVVSNTIIVSEENRDLIDDTYKFTFQTHFENEDDESLRRELGSPSFPDFFPTPKLQRKGASDNLHVTPGITKKEYRDRRHNFMSLLSRTHYGENHDKHAVIITSNPTQYMAPDVPYPFRQDSNFLYLTGFQEPDAVLVLETEGVVPLPFHRSVLYVRPRDAKRELWEGPRAGTKGALEYFGIDEAHPINELSSSLIQKYSNKGYCIWFDHMKPHHPDIHKEISRVLFQTDQFTYKNLLVVGHNVHMLRLIKSDSEIKLMKKSCSVAANAIARVMHSTRPGVQEAHLQTLLEYECRMQGAERLAYPPVIASGSMANTLHYINNTQILRNGELLLMDAGCEFHGYSSDITRTWPVSGKFTEPQRELYELVLRVQKKCIALCQKDISLDYLHHAMLILLGEELTNLGLIKDGLKESQLKKAASEYCPHHLGHYLGMDVHDTHLVGRGLGLQPGMIITVEPGLYIPENAKNVPERYRGIGIRIEDDILITHNTPEVLTSDCPKEVNDIERLMSNADMA